MRGGVKAYEDGIVKEIADNTAVHMETQILDEAEYDTRYLEQARPVAKIGGAQYIRLVDAITAAGPDDTIELLEDNYVFNTITIPETKVFTIQTNGFDIIPSNTITNNGKVTITTRPDASIPTISNYSPNYIIVNSQGADLEINRTNINSAYAINNKGTLTLSNSDIVSSNTSINNTGTINADNISLTANTYPVYNDGGEISATNNSSIQNGTIYNKSGTITMTDSVATNAASTNTSFITNYGALELNGSTASQVITSTGLGYHIWTRTIYNAGSLSANNNSSILQSIDVSTYCYYYLSSIYNDGGNVLVTNSNITTDTATSNYSSIVAGIYNPSGSTVFKTGTINAINRNNVNDSVYGIYNNTGTVTIGVPEPEDSPHYGRDTADVSTSNPDIRAIDLRTRGTINGTGVKNNSGKIYYYDGKIAGTKEALPEKPAGVEYLYEPCTELDTSVTPNLYTAHLFWMRDGQSSCANN